MDANKHFFNFNNANLIYNNINISYYRLHGCLFGSSVPFIGLPLSSLSRKNLQSPCYSMAPSDYEQISSKIHPLWLHICY